MVAGMPGPGETSIGGQSRAFPETLWTVVMRAQDPSSPECREALNELVKAYWKPVYHFLRHRGLSREQAKDLTQEFFAKFLEKDYVRQFDQSKGRFKTFILVTLKHFLSKQMDRDHAQKRGGGARFFQGDFDEAERHVALQLRSPADPERAFTRQWAVSLLQRAMHRLQAECQTQGKEVYLQLLAAHLGAPPDEGSYRTLAQTLGLSESDVRNYLHRIRTRLRQLIVEEVREYVLDDADVESEMQELFLSL
jgi:RNA polymerase sigma factor (sigma-70 family)